MERVRPARRVNTDWRQLVNIRATWIVSGLLALALVPPSLIAQDGWTFGGAVEAGGFLSTRDLGKNVGGVQELQVLQVTSRMDQAPVVGGGFEALMPGGRTMFRALFRTTVSGSASAKVALCKIADDRGALCIPRVVDASIASFLGEIVFLQGEPGDTFRQNFIIGTGIRSYRFTFVECDPDVSLQALFAICELVLPIYQDQASVQPFVEFGFGWSYEAGPINTYMRVLGVVGPYAGGRGTAEGSYQTDATLVGGLSFRVR
jgi:hypothetical protein